jgi:REP element-mobilizing transposase RayT
MRAGRPSVAQDCQADLEVGGPSGGSDGGGAAEPLGWHGRGYLPHFDGGEVTQMVTFRVADSLPRDLLERLDWELQHAPPEERHSRWLRQVERLLDRGHGECWLAASAIAELVQTALLHFDHESYRLHAWVIMPNHVHALLTPAPLQSLPPILKSWKSYTARRANALLDRAGPFWQRDYFDRYIRDEEHFARAAQYIEANPVKARLCADPADWPWSSAGRTRKPCHTGTADL